MEIFSTLAEVAATFVGFAGLAAIISTQSERAKTSYLQVQVVIVWGLIVLGFALLPVLVIDFYSSSDHMFRVLSGLLAIVFLTHELSVLWRIRRMADQGDYQMKPIVYFLMITPGAVVILGTVNALNLLPWNIASVYALCVGMGLAQASAVLLRLFLAFVPMGPYQPGPKP